MTSRKKRERALGATPGETGRADDTCTADAARPVRRDASWQRDALTALALSSASLAWMALEGAIGVYAGARASSVSLLGWALSSLVEGLASII